MTNREYISQRMRGFDFDEAAFADVFSSLSIGADDEYDASYSTDLWKAVIPVLGGLLLAPYLSSVNENGFSLSWNRDSAGKFYLWLCKKYGVTPDEDVVGLLGVSMIQDRSDMW